MNKKIIFLDVDGTILDYTGNVPESAAEAIKKARENGHKLYLCTGRTKTEIYDYIKDIGFDGYVAAGGSYVETDGKVIQNNHLSQADLNHMLTYFNSNKLDYFLETDIGPIASKNLLKTIEMLAYGDVENDPIAKKKKESRSRPFVLDFLENVEMQRTDISKACFILSNEIDFLQIEKEFKGILQAIQGTIPLFGKESGELNIIGVNKGEAIKKLLIHLGKTTEDAIGIGDGNNDIEMLSYCGIGIAMGNSKDLLKQHADYITQDVTNNGIKNAFKHFGII